MNRILIVFFIVSAVSSTYAFGPRTRSQHRPARGPTSLYTAPTHAAPVHAAPAHAAPANEAPTYAEEENWPPQPHSFSYDDTDDEGNQRFHSETGDGNGKVTGSYGYKDAYGVYRVVDYVADENGYRATIRSNEPGMEAPGPADVELNLETPPENVYLGHQLNPASSEIFRTYVAPRRHQYR